LAAPTAWTLALTVVALMAWTLARMAATQEPMAVATVLKPALALIAWVQAQAAPRIWCRAGLDVDHRWRLPGCSYRGVRQL
jgi:hypothetical protein